MSRFNLDRESKPKFLSPNYFSTMAEITPTTSVVVELPETSENPTKASLFTKWELYANLTLCCVLCAITLTAERNTHVPLKRS